MSRTPAGPAVVGLTVADDPATWREVGLPVARLGALRLTWLDGDAGLVGWTLEGDPAGPADVDGLWTQWADGPGSADADEPNPLGIVEADHVVVTTPDPARTFVALEAVGMQLRLEREAGGPERPLRQGFFRHGECRVEVVGPATADRDGGAAVLWGLTLVVADLDAAAAHLGGHAAGPRQAVQPGRRIVTVRRSAGLAVPLALMSPEP